MFLDTRHFGQIEIDEAGIIKFEEGIIGFEDIKEYVLLSNGDQASPFRWLQSLDEPELAFAVIDPFAIRKGYEVVLDEGTIKGLHIKNESDVLILCIVVVPENLSQMSMNLKAPIIINAIKRVGRQVILNTDKYSVRHYINEELQRQEVSEDACTCKEER